VKDHIQIVAWIHIVLDGLVVLGGLGWLLLFGGLSAVAAGVGGRDALPASGLLGIIGVIVFTIVAIRALPGIVAGFGLLRGAGWARILMIVIAILDLCWPPVGTLLGAYALIVLFNPEVVAYFQQTSGRQ
jgi:hypothetical protein